MRLEILRMHDLNESTMVYVTHDQFEALSMGDKIGVLNEGQLEQIGTAREIYRRPSSMFVAQFIGTPMMNIVPVDDITDSHIVWRGHRTPISGELRASLTDARAKKMMLLLGIRAEHISIKGSRWAKGAAPESTMAAVVDRVELAGDQQFLSIRVDGVELTARCEPDLAVTAGETLNIWFDPDELHIFDEETGKALAEDDR
jgi:multiple sugar transport system ATP-binding protein